jgi:hypothetical protein
MDVNRKVTGKQGKLCRRTAAILPSIAALLLSRGFLLAGGWSNSEPISRTYTDGLGA